MEFDHKWPSIACITCLKALNDFKNFKDLCVESERKLKNGEVIFEAAHIKKEPAEEEVVEQEEISPPEPKQQDDESEKYKPMFTLALKDITSLLEPEEKSADETDTDDDIPLAEKFQALQSARPVRKLRTRYKCSHCTDVFCSKMSQIKHMKKVCKALMPFTCVKCKDQFPTFSKLQKHHAREHNDFDNQFKCFSCNLTFESKSLRRTHFNRDHIKCKGCKQYLFTSHDLAAHEKCCTGKIVVRVEESQRNLKNLDEGFICSHCHQKFSDKSSLICHQGASHPGKPVSTTRKKLKGVIFCKDCMVFFNDVGQLQRHYQLDHGNQQNKPAIHQESVKDEKSDTIMEVNADSSLEMKDLKTPVDTLIKIEPVDQEGAGSTPD